YKLLYELPPTESDFHINPFHEVLQPVRLNALKSIREKKKIKTRRVVLEVNEDPIKYVWPCPLIMTVNNIQSKNLRELRNANIKYGSKESKRDSSLIHYVYFSKINIKLISDRLKYICEQEDVECTYTKGKDHP